MNSNDNLKLFVEAFTSMPFNKRLGLTPDCFDCDNACIRFSMRDELLGNPYYNILHGGVISAILDLEGAFTLGLYRSSKMEAQPRKKLSELFQGATIDFRVDFLVPGRGNHFVCSSHILHIGKKVSVVRTELHNEQQQLIAVGTCSYLMG